jgi:hypothetical protein
MLDARAVAISLWGPFRRRHGPGGSPLRDGRAFFAMRDLLRGKKRKAAGTPDRAHTQAPRPASSAGPRPARRARTWLSIRSTVSAFTTGSPLPRAGSCVAERLASRVDGRLRRRIGGEHQDGGAGGNSPAGRCRFIRSGFDTGSFLAGSRVRGRASWGSRRRAGVCTSPSSMPQKAPLDFVETAPVAKEVPAPVREVGDGELRSDASAQPRRGARRPPVRITPGRVKRFRQPHQRFDALPAHLAVGRAPQGDRRPLSPRSVVRRRSTGRRRSSSTAWTAARAAGGSVVPVRGCSTSSRAAAAADRGKRERLFGCSDRTACQGAGAAVHGAP